MLVMGHTEGPGCYCHANDLLRGFLEKLARVPSNLPEHGVTYTVGTLFHHGKMKYATAIWHGHGTFPSPTRRRWTTPRASSQASWRGTRSSW